MEAIKKFHEEGFIVIETPMGDVTIALPDAPEGDEFELEVEHTDGVAERIIMKFE